MTASHSADFYCTFFSRSDQPSSYYFTTSVVYTFEHTTLQLPHSLIKKSSLPFTIVPCICRNPAFGTPVLLQMMMDLRLDSKDGRPLATSYG